MVFIHVVYLVTLHTLLLALDIISHGISHMASKVWVESIKVLPAKPFDTSQIRYIFDSSGWCSFAKKYQ